MLSTDNIHEHPPSQHTLLGGINLVDYDPWAGNYTDVLVRKNTILGGFADDLHEAEVNQTKGESDEDVIIKYVTTCLAY